MLTREYPPAFILDCERSVDGAAAMVRAWLQGNMFSAELSPRSAAATVTAGLMNYAETTEHGHHFLIEKCQEIGLKVVAVEDDQAFQEALLSFHHCCMATFSRTDAVKLIDNSNGVNWNTTSP